MSSSSHHIHGNPLKFPSEHSATSLDSNKWLKSFPCTPPIQDTESKQKTNRKPNKEPKILGNRTRSGSDEDNMRGGWGGFPSFFFFFFLSLNARFRVQQTLLLALTPTRAGHAQLPAPGQVRHGPLCPLAVGTALLGSPLTVGGEGRSQCVGLKVTVGRAKGSQCNSPREVPWPGSVCPCRQNGASASICAA